MKVLITGGMGFIGSHLADRYDDAGWKVYALDNLTANVVDVDHPSFESVIIADAQALTARAVAAVDLVVHAASPVGAAAILPAQGTIAGEIVHSTQRVIEACIGADVPLINISTSEVYGKTGRASEKDGFTVPARFSARLEYQVGKMAAEQAVAASCARGLAAVQIRPWNVAGPREAAPKGFVIPRMVTQALTGEALTVFDSGQQERAFTGVWDLARFITGYLPDDFDEWCGQPYNVGNEENRTTINHLAEIVLEVTGSRSEIIHTTGRDVFGKRYEEASAGTKLPNSRRAHALGWRPRNTLRDIIARTAADLLTPGEPA